MDSGRYFRLVRLAWCLKRMPDAVVTSSKSGGVTEPDIALSNLAAGAAASKLSRNDRRLIFGIKLSLLSANRRGRFAGLVGIFFCKGRLGPPGGHLALQAGKFPYDEASLV